jgi:hypothetical protein
MNAKVKNPRLPQEMPKSALRKKYPGAKRRYAGMTNITERSETKPRQEGHLATCNQLKECKIYQAVETSSLDWTSKAMVKS